MPRILSAERLARIRIHLGQFAGILFIVFAQPRNRIVFLAGFLMAIAGESLRIWAAGTIKKNRELARTGPYALVRHPLYLGSFLIVAGFCLASLNPYRLLLTLALWAIALCGFYWVYSQKMRDEDDKLMLLFGSQFSDYRRRTRAFWPDFKHPGDLWSAAFDFRLAFKNQEQLTILGILAVASILWMKLIYQV